MRRYSQKIRNERHKQKLELMNEKSFVVTLPQEIISILEKEAKEQRRYFKSQIESILINYVQKERTNL